MRGIVFSLLMCIASSVGASVPWTNEALAPSYSVARGMPTTIELLGRLGVPECAIGLLSSRIHTGQGQPLMVSNNYMFSPVYDYSTDMVMTFKSGGKDYITRVHPYVDSPFVASVYSYECDGYTGDIAYMPKCQNLAVLKRTGLVPGHQEPHTGQGHDNHQGNGYGHVKHTATVDAPLTLILIIVGILVFLCSRWAKL